MTETSRFRKVTGTKPKGSPIGQTGRIAEKKLQSRIGGRATIGSGNRPQDKGDLRFESFLMETKACEGESYGLKHELLAKITREALEKQCHPAFHVQFVDGTGRPKKFGSWVMVPEALWEMITADVSLHQDPEA